MGGMLKRHLRWMIGIPISLLFIYLAFRKVEIDAMWEALKQADYLYLPPILAVLFLSHYLRALRWRYLLDPLRRVDTRSLFSSLLIGYMANAFTPAHLGEFLRAFFLSRKRSLPMGSVFATIVVERVIDMFSLLALMPAAIFLYPFPDWVTRSGYIMLALTVGMMAFLVLLRVATASTLNLLGFILKPLPNRFTVRLLEAAERFIAGVQPLRRRQDYGAVAGLSVLIWGCYGVVFHLALVAFDFNRLYQLPWSASLILLVITTIAVVVPSSPGYVGTYHYLCQLSLALYQVPAGPALSFAAVAHAVNFVPVLIVGLLLAHFEGIKLSRIGAERSEPAGTMREGSSDSH